MRYRGRAITRVVVGAGLAVALVMPVAPDVEARPVDSTSVAVESWRSAAAAPAVSELEGLLPPGVRQILSAFKIFKGLSARNRVYREAGGVQSDLRAYYGARIEKAQEQLLNREILGLEPSQVRAYTRVKAQLEAERDVALAVTEFEKRAAKYGFESAFKRELTSALLRVPRVQAGLSKMRSAVEDLQDRLGAVQTAIESGNPISALTAEIDEKVRKVERFGALASLISGKAGENILAVTERVRETIAPIQDSIDDASGATGQAIAELESLRTALDQSTEESRSPRAGLDVALDEGSVLDKIVAVSGAGPAAEAVASVIARQATRQANDQRGEARVELARMRDRVQAAVLGRSLQRIGEICGRLVGAIRRAQLEAAASGDPGPATSSPCTDYGNPAALQALIDAERAAQQTAPTTTTATAPAPAGTAPPGTGGPAPDSETWEIAFTGSADIAGSTLQSGWTATLILAADGAITGAGDGSVAFSGDCTAGENGEPGGEVLSQIESLIAFDIDVTGKASGTELNQSLAIEYTASNPTLTSYIETSVSGEGEPCRGIVESQLSAILDLLGGSVTIDASDGAQAEATGTVSGAATITGPT